MVRLKKAYPSGDYVVFAGCTTGQVGIDVMKVELRRNTTLDKFFSLMTRQFTASEWRFINNSDTAERESRLFNFYRCWCLKESYVKAIGTGIKFGLQRIEFLPGCIVDDACTTTSVKIDGELQEGWMFHESMFDGHIMALAVRGGEGVGQVERVEFEDLLTVDHSNNVGVRYFNEFDVKKEVP